MGLSQDEDVRCLELAFEAIRQEIDCWLQNMAIPGRITDHVFMVAIYSEWFWASGIIVGRWFLPHDLLESYVSDPSLGRGIGGAGFRA